LFLSLLVILGCRQMLGPQFETWGWRLPFLVSLLLLVISVYIRLQLRESPVFLEMKSAGRTSRSPLTDSFARWENLRFVLLALLGATAGQAVVWYCGQFYSLFFLTQTLKVDAQTANLLVAGALVLATPFFVVFGWASDRVGRKKIVLGGCLLAALTYFPLFAALTHYANPAIEHARQTSPIVVVADPADCHFQFDPIGKARFTSSCDIAKSALAKAGVPYENEAAAAGSVGVVRVGSTAVASFDGRPLAPAEFKERSDAFGKELTATLHAAGYPPGADPARINKPMVLLILTVLVIYVTMVYGPIAAWLVELFPPRIRYTSMSLPYHVGNGWFGGFLPTVSFALVALTGDIYYGLWYPIVVAVFTAVVGAVFLPDKRDEGVADVAGSPGQQVTPT
jgi:MFS family permease